MPRSLRRGHLHDTIISARERTMSEGAGELESAQRPAQRSDCDSQASIMVGSPQSDSDWQWLKELWLREWGADTMVSKGKTVHFADLQAVMAWQDGAPTGAATYALGEDGCEVVSINATVSGAGVGTRLLTAVEMAAQAAGATRTWLITSNDNVDALRFYQRRGYRLVAVYPGAVDQARAQKPTIPLVGLHGIPLHDELELEKPL